MHQKQPPAKVAFARLVAAVIVVNDMSKLESPIIAIINVFISASSLIKKISFRISISSALDLATQ
jgi:hypothetical protein